MSDFTESRLAVLGLVLFVTIVLVAVLAPLISPQNPYDLAQLDITEGRLPPGAQAKLLRFLEARTFKRVGGVRDITVNVRIVASTNRDLEAAVRDGGFRRDLFFRLNVIPIVIPPLRERPEDVPPLAEYFLAKMTTALRRPARRITKEAMAMLERYAWPGNVRELENAVERAMVVAQEPELRAGDFLLRPRAAGGEPQTLEEVERVHILQVMEQCGGNQTRAAGVLDIDRVTLHNKLKRYGWTRPSVEK